MINGACYSVMVPKSARGVSKRDIYRLPLLEGGFGTKIASRRDDILVWHYLRGFRLKGKEDPTLGCEFELPPSWNEEEHPTPAVSRLDRT